MATLQLLPLAGTGKRIVWHIVDSRSAVGPPRGQLVYGIVRAGRTRRTGRANASGVRIVVGRVGLLFDDFHVRDASPARRSLVGRGGRRRVMAIVAVAAALTGRAMAAVVLVVVRRPALGFGGTRPRTTGTGAVALGAGQRVLEVTLEADFFLNY